jgi:uncharacterized protein (DUF2336 family)
LRAELSNAAAQHPDELQDTSTIKLQREVAKLIEVVEWQRKYLEETLDAARVQVSCAGMVLVCIIDNHCLTHFLSGIVSTRIVSTILTTELLARLFLGWGERTGNFVVLNSLVGVVLIPLILRFIF